MHNSLKKGKIQYARKTRNFRRNRRENTKTKMVSLQDNQKFTKNPILKGVIETSIIPIVAYLIAFEYEKGYCDVFGIPPEFISLTPTVIIFTIIVIIPVMLGLFFPVNLIYMILPNKWKRYIFPIIVILIFVGYLGWLTRLRTKYDILFLGIFLFIIIFSELILPVITQRNQRGYLSKLEAQDKLDREIDTLIDIITRHINPKWILLFAFVLDLSVFSELLGKHIALTQEKFYVINTPELTAVVLRIYNEKLICAPFIKETKELQNTFFIINMATQQKLILTKEKVGPFKTKEE